MKSKTTNIFIIVAASLCLLALFIHLFIFCGPQEFFYMLGSGNPNSDFFTKVSDPIGILRSVILCLSYLAVCLITVLSKKKKPGKIACFTLVIVNFVYCYLFGFFENVYLSIFLKNQNDTHYTATYSVLNYISNLIESPLMGASLILLCISLGTLLGKDEPQLPTSHFQNTYY